MARHDLYIYYQVSAANAALLAGRVRAMQAALGQGQLKQRPEASAGLLTWMEIYAGVDTAFEAALAEALAAARVLELTAGPRHTEIFTDLDPMDASPCA